MNDPALDLVRSYYERFNAGDWDGMCELLADDVAHDLNQGRRETGRAAFRAFLARMAGSYHEQLVDIVLLGAAADAPGRIAAEYVVEGTYLKDDEGLPPAHGQPYRLAGGAFFTVEDGRIARVTNYYNLQEWIAQITA